jgi:hypothetical protein
VPSVRPSAADRGTAATAAVAGWGRRGGARVRVCADRAATTLTERGTSRFPACVRRLTLPGSAGDEAPRSAGRVGAGRGGRGAGVRGGRPLAAPAPSHAVDAVLGDPVVPARRCVARPGRIARPGRRCPGVHGRCAVAGGCPVDRAGVVRRRLPLRLGREGAAGRDRPVPVRPVLAPASGAAGCVLLPSSDALSMAAGRRDVQCDQPTRRAHRLSAGGSGRVRADPTGVVRRARWAPSASARRRPRCGGRDDAAGPRGVGAQASHVDGGPVGVVPGDRPRAWQRCAHRLAGRAAVRARVDGGAAPSGSGRSPHRGRDRGQDLPRPAAAVAVASPTGARAGCCRGGRRAVLPAARGRRRLPGDRLPTRLPRRAAGVQQPAARPAPARGRRQRPRRAPADRCGRVGGAPHRRRRARADGRVRGRCRRAGHHARVRLVLAVAAGFGGHDGCHRVAACGPGAHNLLPGAGRLRRLGWARPGALRERPRARVCDLAAAWTSAQGRRIRPGSAGRRPR